MPRLKLNKWFTGRVRVTRKNGVVTIEKRSLIKKKTNRKRKKR